MAAIAVASSGARLVTCGFLLVGVMTLPVCAHALTARPDQITVPASGIAYLDLLANDENVNGREMSVTLSTNGVQGLLIQDNGDGGVVISLLPPTDPDHLANGDQSFSYRIADGTRRNGKLVQRAATVRVCWGNALCPTSAGDEPGPEEPEEPEEPEGACTGLCFRIDGIRYLAGELHDFGTAPSGTVRTIPLTIENGLSAPVNIDAILLGNPQAMRWEETGSASIAIHRTLAGKSSVTVNVIHAFLPPPAGSTRVANAVFVQEKPTPSTEGRSWGMSLTSAGDGVVTVPGFEDCELNDVCLYVDGAKVASTFGGSTNHVRDFGTVPIGEVRSVPLTLVYNDLSGVAAIPFQFLPAAGFRAMRAGVSVSASNLEPRQPLQMTLEHAPAHAGSVDALIQFNVGLAGQAVAFRARATAIEPGADCERCDIQFDGVHFANGQTIDVGSRPTGTVELFEVKLRNTARRDAQSEFVITGGNGAVSHNAPNVIDLKPGAITTFQVRIAFVKGSNRVTLQLRKLVTGVPVFQSVGLVATGVGDLAGNAQCPSSQFEYCFLIDGKRVDAALPNAPAAPTRPVFDAGLMAFADKRQFDITAINNLPVPLNLQIQELQGALEILSGSKTAPGPRQPPGTVFQVPAFGGALTLLGELTWRSAFGRLEQEPALAKLRFIVARGGAGVGEQRTVYAVANCNYIVCIFVKSEHAGWFFNGPKGFVGTPGAVASEEVLFYTKQLASPFAMLFQNTSSSPVHVRFATTQDRIVAFSTDAGFAYQDSIQFTFPTGTVTNELRFNSGGGVPFPTGPFLFTGEAQPSQFPSCGAALCLFRNVDRNKDEIYDLQAPDRIAGSGQTGRYETVVAAGALQEGTPWVLVNNTDQLRRIELQITPQDRIFSLGSLATSARVHDDVRWLQPRSSVPVVLEVRGRFFAGSDVLRVTSEGIEPLLVDLFNGTVRPYAECRDLCIEVNGTPAIGGGTVALNAPLGQQATATIRLINGAEEARAFELTLKEASGFISTDPNVSFAGAGCVAASDEHVCSGNAAGGTAVATTLRYAATPTPRLLTFEAKAGSSVQRFVLRIVPGTVRFVPVSFGARQILVPVQTAQ